MEESKEKIELTPEQEKIMLDVWNLTPANPPSISTLSLAIFHEEHKGNDKYGKAIMRALSRHSIKPKVSTVYEKKSSSITLSDNDKLFIENNRSTMNAVDLARFIFKNPAIMGIHAESRVISEYVSTLDPSVKYEGEDIDIPKGEYRPPKTLDAVLKRVNNYKNGAFDRDKLTAKQRKELMTLIDYLHTHRLIKQVNNYDKQEDRDTFEDDFIRNTYNKSDLTEEEVGQYIMLSHEVVSSFKIQRRIERLQNMLENVADNASSTENVKISMSLVEAISSAAKEGDECIKRQKSLLNDLTGKRSSRLSKQMQDNGSILNLLNAWKEEEVRKDFLAIAKIEQDSVANEVRNLSDMDDIRARILGLTKEEILNG